MHQLIAEITALTHSPHQGFCILEGNTAKKRSFATTFKTHVRLNISPKMRPALQQSTLLSQLLFPKMSSGARYHLRVFWQMCILNLGGQIKASNLKRRNIASRDEEAIARTMQGKSMGGVTSAVHVWHGALACCAEGEGRLMKDQVTAEVRFLAWKTSVLWCDTSLIARLQFCFTCGHRGRISRVQLARKVSHCAVIRINAKLGVKYAATPPLVWMA